MKTEKEVRMRLNTYKLVRKERKEKRKGYNAIDDVLFERSIKELEWMLE